MKTITLLLIFLLSIPSLAKVESQALSEETLRQFKNVPEFAFIIQEAEKLGVKVYLFGGTASAFAHYVRWDLERQKGDTKYQAEKFDYDFTTIYRSNQDLDLVVDGTPEQAKYLQRVLREKYPHFIGIKDAWEVRLLNARIGEKLPLLNNYDFLNQHTDTNSIGMLALNPDKDDIIYRDLFDWDNIDSEFLNDVAQARIRYIFSPSHESTSRYRDGKNPPIFSAVRYLAKLTQYEIQGHPDDLKIIRRIIERTNWRKLSSYVQYKLKEFGLKILLNSPNSEYAWNLMDDLGLREKLIKMDGDRTNDVDSLSWWLNKEPLRSFELGKGNGRTAAEIFEELENNDFIVSHETNSLQAYDNITRSSQGLANVFISRNVPGESAASGEGFYTAIGQKGARGTNLTIRFKLNPEAREGTDFSFHRDVIVVHNKNALLMIQENLNISIIDFLKVLTSGGFENGDLGLKEKFMRKFGRVDTDSVQFKEAVQFVKDHFFISEKFPWESSLRKPNFSDIGFSALITLYTDTRKQYYLRNILPLLRQQKKSFYENPHWLIEIIRKGDILSEIINDVLSSKAWAEHPDAFNILSVIMDNADDQAYMAMASSLFSKAHWIQHPRLIEIMKNFINQVRLNAYSMREDILATFVENSLSQRIWTQNKQHFEVFEILLKEDMQDDLGSQALSIGEAGNIVTLKGHIVSHILTQEHWLEHPRSSEIFEAVKVPVVVSRVHSNSPVHVAYRPVITKCISLIHKNPESMCKKHLPSLLKQLEPNMLSYVNENFFEGDSWKINRQFNEDFYLLIGGETLQKFLKIPLQDQITARARTVVKKLVNWGPSKKQENDLQCIEVLNP